MATLHTQKASLGLTTLSTKKPHRSRMAAGIRAGLRGHHITEGKIMDKEESDFLCLLELGNRATTDPANTGWYMHRAYMLGTGCSVDEVLESPAVKPSALTLVKAVSLGDLNPAQRLALARGES